MDISEIDRSKVYFKEIENDTSCNGIIKSDELEVCGNKYLKAYVLRIGEFLIKDLLLTFYQNKLVAIEFEPPDSKFLELFLKKYPETAKTNEIIADYKSIVFKWVNSEKKITANCAYSENKNKKNETDYEILFMSIRKDEVSLMIKNCIEEFKTRKKKECEAELLKKF